MIETSLCVDFEGAYNVANPLLFGTGTFFSIVSKCAFMELGELQDACFYEQSVKYVNYIFIVSY
jgi:hypothetical protein